MLECYKNAKKKKKTNVVSPGGDAEQQTKDSGPGSHGVQKTIGRAPGLF